jgi:hypothetical protein
MMQTFEIVVVAWKKDWACPAVAWPAKLWMDGGFGIEGVERVRRNESAGFLFFFALFPALSAAGPQPAPGLPTRTGSETFSPTASNFKHGYFMAILKSTCL